VAEFGVTMTDMASAVIGLGDMVGDEPPPHPLVVKAVTTTKAKPSHTRREFMGTLSDSGLTFARAALQVNPAQHSNFSSGPHELTV
jgi:hypothetical protein